MFRSILGLELMTLSKKKKNPISEYDNQTSWQIAIPELVNRTHTRISLPTIPVLDR